MHLENLDSKRKIVQDFTANQCSGESVIKFLKNVRTTKTVTDPEKDAEDFFEAWQAGFKGLD